MNRSRRNYAVSSDATIIRQAIVPIDLPQFCCLFEKSLEAAEDT